VSAVTDRGLFGPDSVTWRVMREPVLWVAGFRALYLQALHPRVMRGTWQNTSFARSGEAWGRFVRTAEFIGVRTYGTTDQVASAGRRIRKLHASLTGTEPDGTRFRLDEPELLLWVHCGEISSYVDIVRRSGVGLSAADLDAFVDEQRRSAAVVGLDPGTVPATVAGLDAYYERMRPGRYACAEAKQALRSTPGSPVTDLGATVALRMAHQSMSRIPRRLLYLPAARVQAPDGGRFQAVITG